MKNILRLATAVVVLTGNSAFASTGTWTGTSSTPSDSLWSNGGNWTATPAPGTADTATFNSAGNGKTTIDLGAGITVGALTFDTANAAAYTIGTGSSQNLTMSTGAITVNSTVTNNETIAATLNLNNANGTPAITNSSATSTLTLSNITSTTASAKALTVTNTGSVNANGVISNGTSSALSLKKLGTGTMTISNANTYTGGTTVGAGTLTVTNATGLGVNATAAAITLNGGGTLNLLNDGAGSNGTITYGAGGYNVTASSKASTINVDHNTSGNTGNTIALGSLTASVGLTFTNGDGYNLSFGASSMSGSPAFTNNMNSGTVTFASLTNTETTGNRTLTFDGLSNTAVTSVGAINQGVSPNTVSLVQSGYGTLKLTGASGYKGSTTINSGTLVLANSTGAATGGSALVLGGGALSDIGSSATVPGFSGTTVNFGGSTISTSGTTGHVLALGAIGRGAGSTFGTVNFIPGSSTSGAAGSISTTSANNVTGLLGGWATVNGSDWAMVGSGGQIQAYNNYNTTVPTTGGSTSANYLLTSGLNLTGNLSANSLKISDAGSDTLNIGANNLTLALNGANNASAGLTSGGLLVTGGGNYTINGTGIIGSGSSSGSEFMVNVDSGTKLTINTIIGTTIVGNSGSLTKSGAGELVLTNASSAYRSTVIDGGTLTVSHLADAGVASDIGSSVAASNPAAGLVIDGGTLKYVGATTSTNRNFEMGSAGATLDASGTGALTMSGNMTNLINTTAGIVNLTLTGTNTGANTLSGVLANGSSTSTTAVTKTGVGNWVLSGANTYTGGTYIDNGTLTVGVSDTSATVGALGGSGQTVVLGDVSGSNNAGLLIGGAFTLGNAITVQSGSSGTATIGGSNTGGTSTYTGAITMNKALTLQAATGGTTDFNTGLWMMNNFALTIGSAGKTGTVELDHALATTGGIAVNFGTLALDAAYTGNATVGSGATLSGTGSVSGTTGVTSGTVNGSGLALNGLTTFNSTGNTLSGTETGNVAVASSGALTQTGGTLTGNVSQGSSSSFTVNGTVSGSDTMSSGASLGGSGSIGAVSLAGNNHISGSNTLTTGNTTVSGTGNEVTGGTVNGGANTINTGASMKVDSGATWKGSSITDNGTLNLASNSNISTTGALAVNSGATLEGSGTSGSATLNVTGNSTATANILVGHTVGDTNTTGVLTLNATNPSNLGAATLQFNLNTNNITVGGVSESNTLAIGSTPISFNTVDGMNVTLALNLNGNVTGATSYLLIDGTALASQYSGITTFVNGDGRDEINPGVLDYTLAGGTADHSYLYIDDNRIYVAFKPEATPEPSTWALMIGGLGVLVYWRRKSQARPADVA